MLNYQRDNERSVNVFLLFGSLAVGGVIGYRSSDGRTKRVADGIVLAGIAVVLFAIGAQIGSDRQLLADFGAIGSTALVLCLGSVVGSVLCLHLGTSLAAIVTPPAAVADGGSARGADRPLPETTATASGVNWRLTAIVFGSLAAGLVLAAGVLPAEIASGLEPVSDYALLALLFGVGLAVGSDTASLGYVTRIGWSVFLIPVAVAIGSVLGGVVSGLAVGVPIAHGAAVAAGFGWYSYAGVVVFDLGYAQLGAIAFLANFLREILTFLVLPVTARYLGGVTAIAPGGATTMDVTLPVIQRVSGEEFVVPALVNGIVLTAAATALVPLLLGL